MQLLLAALLYFPALPVYGLSSRPESGIGGLLSAMLKRQGSSSRGGWW